jgi:hypothetical protein
VKVGPDPREGFGLAETPSVEQALLDHDSHGS